MTFNRITPAYVVIVLLTVLLAPTFLLTGGKVHASPGQIQFRSIQMSDDTVNTSGSTANYNVQFNTATAGAIGAIVVDFCNTDPIPGDTCVAPVGFTLTGASYISGTNTSGYTVNTANSGRTFEISNAGASSLPSATTVSFAITGVTNPTVVGTFYARIFTFALPGDAATWIAAAADGSTTTGYVDYGGIALSTVQTILVTSKIQEQISFCVYIVTCGTQAAINLGDSHDVLSISAPFADNTTTYYLSTNASHGAVINLKGNTLQSGTNSIPAAGTTPYLYGTPSTNINFFGMCSYTTSGEVLTVATDYVGNSNGGSCASVVTDTGGTAVITSLGTPYATFGFNATATTSTYGDLLATMPVAGATIGQVVLAAGVNVTQPSGIYTTTLQLIAIGTY